MSDHVEQYRPLPEGVASLLRSGAVQRGADLGPVKPAANSAGRALEPGEARFKEDAPLSKRQVIILSRAAARAFEAALAADPDGLPEGQSRTAYQTAWRHAQQRRVIGTASLKEATQKHFLPMLSHYAQICGETGTAFLAELGRTRAAGAAGAADDSAEAVQAAYRQVYGMCQRAGVKLSYAAAIARRKFGHGELSALTAKELLEVRNTVYHSRLKGKGGKAS